ncbi:hypothetical protein BC937DRAFT_87200 [Endogone sp. FLAS-F59071]|nr:hypothetical protein BC937DRAFT_87200 [Endogone sp. FLAS-F59071]|eukprot:RUS19611.1 hypothetical protein BC937DRAFT_87200 [Endogone sp. FLAS-F59071]
MPPKKQESSPATEQAPAKQRGRPRKVVLPDAEAAAEVEKTDPVEEPEAEEEEDKEQGKVDKPKRGRPPKPKGDETLAPVLVAATGEPATKRPRGRPPKPRNPDVEVKKVTGPKRGRGRPKKSSVTSSTAASASRKIQTNSDDDDVSMEDAENSDDKTHGPIQESGHIYFFYRPKVDAPEVNGAEDVQRLYLVLKPSHTKLAGSQATSASAQPKTRLVVVTRKKLPEIQNRSRYWGFVRKATSNVEELANYLDEEKYGTKTKGSRKLQPARPAGEGVYAIVEHNGHTHLAYILTLPKEPGEVQEAFNIGKEGSYIISVKNPEKPNPPYAGLSASQKARFPSHLQEAFHNLRFIPVSTPEYLNVDNCEILLIGTSEDVSSELGPSGKTLHKMEEDDEEEVARLGQDHVIFGELRLKKDKHPAEPLRGEWK